MPDVSYTVLIKDERAKQEEKKKIASTPNGSAEKKSDDNVKLPPQLRKVASVEFAVSVADTALSFRTSTVELRTGNSTYQARATAMHQSAKGIVNAGMTIFGVSAAFGPVGAVTAAVGIGANAMLQYAIETEQYRIRETVNTYEVQQANIRAGAYGNRGGSIR